MSKELQTQNASLVHKLFYWPYPEGYVLSKTKLATLFVFAYFFIFWMVGGAHPFFVVLSIIFALVTFLVGLVFHKILGEPTPYRARNNDFGLFIDIKNLLFFWQDKNGNYVLSKTKIVSLIVFLLTFVIGIFSLRAPLALGSVLIGFLVWVPTFAIGTVIHKLTFEDSPKKAIPNKKTDPKKVEKVKTIPQKPPVISEYVEYQIQLDELNSKFIKKEKSTRDIIKKRFEPPQITYTRFISGVDKSAELFKKHRDSAFTMINLADEYSPRIASEVESKIEILNSIIQKLSDLSNELVLNNDLSKDEDVDGLINDMDDLIDSVKRYD